MEESGNQRFNDGNGAESFDVEIYVNSLLT